LFLKQRLINQVNKLIIGSTAIKHWFPDFREPKDIDYICSDCLITKEKQNYWIEEFSELIKLNKDSNYLDADLLFNLKLSHLGWNIHWEKTANDVLFLKRKNCIFNPELYQLLVKGWTKLHGEKWVKLKDKSADSFFDDYVNRKYVHDDIHKVVAVGKNPLYFKILEKENSVKCSKEKFNNLDLEDKLNLVREEIWVTALERYLIPSNFTTGDNLSYYKALKKLTTTMSSGWFKMFIIEYFHLLHRDTNKTWVKKFKEAEKIGNIKQLKQTTKLIK
jgi:hypothetical protein